MRRKPDLIFPERRQRTRYLTLRNFRNAILVLLVLFTIVSIRSELRRPDGTGYGRLVERELAPPVAPKPVEVVATAGETVPDATHADPMLVEPLVREQWIRPEGDVAIVPVGDTRAEASVATGQTEVAIVGGPEGVAVVQQERRRPVLAGGFGRQ